LPPAAAVAALSLAALAGCATLPPLERQALLDASRQYTQDDLAGAMTTLNRLIRDYDATPEIAEAYYVRGLCRSRLQQPQAAGEDFERGISRSRRADLTARCRASLAALAFARGDWKRAADLYSQSVRELPDVPPTDAVLYTAGLSMQRAGDWDKAGFQFARIIDKFRNRPIAAEARRLAAWRHPYYAILLGAYRDADSAGKAVHTLRQQGFDAGQEYLQQADRPVWAVLAGHYATYDEARTALAGIHKRQPGATLVP
jgi:tetratricopeptide (TPR) repeat protein